MARLPKYMKQIDQTTIKVKWWGVIYLILSRVRWRFFIPFIGLIIATIEGDEIIVDLRYTIYQIYIGGGCLVVLILKLLNAI